MIRKVKRAFVFPGQGSQFVGMGQDLYNNFSEAKAVFEEVCDSLNFNLTKVIFDGPEADLTLTSNTQPALMAVSMAVVKVLEKLAGKELSQMGDYIAGHSLGEYSALCAAQSLTLKDTAWLLKVRGSAMQNACLPGQGAMAAIINMPIEKLEKILINCKDDGVCEIANDNSESQIVISGTTNAIDRVIAIVKDLGFKAIKLNVSAPFHSSLMNEAANQMQQALQDIEMKIPQLKFVANISACQVNEQKEIIEGLAKQVVGRVKWRETINHFEAQNVEEIIEVGAGKVLTGLLKRSNKNFVLKNLEQTADIEEFLKEII